LFSNINKFKSDAAGRTKMLIQKLLAQPAPVSATITHLLQVTAPAGGQDQPIQPGLGYPTRYLLGSSLGAGFSYFLDAGNLVTTGQFNRESAEVYDRVDAASASAQEYPYASPISE
jgi:hypothetical protein